MDGIRNLVGKREARVVLDKSYRLTVRTLDDYAERESYILWLKREPSSLLLGEILPQTVRDAIETKARLSRFVSLEEDLLFDQSMHGLSYRFWQAVQFHHSDEIQTPDDAYQILYRHGRGKLVELQAKLSCVEEQDILGRLIYPNSDSDSSSEDRRHRRRIAWAKIFRQLSEKFNWTPEQIGKLTLYRAMVLLGALCPEDIRKTVFR